MLVEKGKCLINSSSIFRLSNTILDIYLINLKILESRKKHDLSHLNHCRSLKQVSIKFNHNKKQIEQKSTTKI